MKVFHRTDYSEAILREGFRNTTARYGATREYTGVWVSDRPLDENEGACGDVVLTLDVPTGVFKRYEWIEKLKGYRESLIPAVVLNTLGTPRRVSNDELDRLELRRCRRRKCELQQMNKQKRPNKKPHRTTAARMMP